MICRLKISSNPTSLPNAVTTALSAANDHAATGRPRPGRLNSDASVAASDVAGRNFFDEVASFENAEELRGRILDFTNSERQADNFHFTCLCDGGPLTVKVLLARIRERSNGSRTKSILVHIRKV